MTPLHKTKEVEVSDPVGEELQEVVSELEANLLRLKRLVRQRLREGVEVAEASEGEANGGTE